MAIFTPTTSSDFTVKRWHEGKLLIEAIRETYFGKLVSEGENAMIKLQTDLSANKKGDLIHYHLLNQLTQRGATEGDTLVNNEEALSFYDDSVTINELRFAVRVPGLTNIGHQRTTFDQYEYAAPLLKTLIAQRLDTWLFNQFCGYTVQTDTIYTGMNSVVAVDANHIVRVGASANDQSLGSGDTFTLNFIDKMLYKARNTTKPILPGPDGYYSLFLHDDQAYSLEVATSGQNWETIQRAAMTGGKIDDNPLFTGALGVYKNVVIHRTPRVTQGVRSDTGAAITTVRRAVLVGRNAGVLALGGVSDEMSGDNVPLTMTEESFDYGHERGVASNQLIGFDRTNFNSEAYGVIVGSSYATAP